MQSVFTAARAALYKRRMHVIVAVSVIALTFGACAGSNTESDRFRAPVSSSAVLATSSTTMPFRSAFPSLTVDFVEAALESAGASCKREPEVNATALRLRCLLDLYPASRQGQIESLSTLAFSPDGQVVTILSGEFIAGISSRPGDTSRNLAISLTLIAGLPNASTGGTDPAVFGLLPWALNRAELHDDRYFDSQEFGPLVASVQADASNVLTLTILTTGP